MPTARACGRARAVSAQAAELAGSGLPAAGLETAAAPQSQPLRRFAADLDCWRLQPARLNCVELRVESAATASRISVVVVEAAKHVNRVASKTMTLSSLSGHSGQRYELNDSVRELDNLLEDLKCAQNSADLAPGTKSGRLERQSHYYNSTASLYVPGREPLRPSQRPNSASSANSPTPLKKLAASQQAELDAYRAKLESELSQAREPAAPRGVLVKDVVEEEILVDHVHVQPQVQQAQRKFSLTKAAPHAHHQDKARRQVAFSDSKPTRSDRDETGSETYDNTDQEDNSAQQVPTTTGTKRPPGSGSQLSLNSSLATDATEGSSSVLEPGKTVHCFVCDERVVGQVITALGRNYHKQHFTCAHCHQELGTRNFYERDNQPYCERDYQALFSPKCAACSEPILDVSIRLDSRVDLCVTQL